MDVAEQKIIKLPPANITGHMDLETAIKKRRSIRSFNNKPLKIEEISQLLWAAQGITGSKTYKRAAPSAGGRCPLEFYACWDAGVWRYDPIHHRLAHHLEEDIRAKLSIAALSQEFIAQAGCVFVMSAQFAKTTERYGDRGRARYVLMDAGHAAQNVLLQAVALGFGSVPVGAFDDTAVHSLLKLPFTEEPLYILPVGHPAG